MSNNSTQHYNSCTNKSTGGNSSDKTCTTIHGDTIQNTRHSTTNEWDRIGISSKATTTIPKRICTIDEESISNGEQGSPSHGGHG